MTKILEYRVYEEKEEYGTFYKVKQKGKYGLIDKNNNFILPSIYDSIYVDNSDEHYVITERPEAIGIYNTKDKTMSLEGNFQDIDKLYSFYNESKEVNYHFRLTSKNSNPKAKDITSVYNAKTGKVVIPPSTKIKVLHQSEQIVVRKSSDTQQLYNVNGEYLFSIESDFDCEKVTDNILMIKRTGPDKFYDVETKKLIFKRQLKDFFSVYSTDRVTITDSYCFKERRNKVVEVYDNQTKKLTKFDSSEVIYNIQIPFENKYARYIVLKTPSDYQVYGPSGITKLNDLLEPPHVINGVPRAHIIKKDGSEDIINITTGQSILPKISLTPKSRVAAVLDENYHRKVIIETSSKETFYYNIEDEVKISLPFTKITSNTECNDLRNGIMYIEDDEHNILLDTKMKKVLFEGEEITHADTMYSYVEDDKGVPEEEKDLLREYIYTGNFDKDVFYNLSERKVTLELSDGKTEDGGIGRYTVVWDDELFDDNKPANTLVDITTGEQVLPKHYDDISFKGPSPYIITSLNGEKELISLYPFNIVRENFKEIKFKDNDTKVIITYDDQTEEINLETQEQSIIRELVEVDYNKTNDKMYKQDGIYFPNEEAYDAYAKPKTFSKNKRSNK